MEPASSQKENALFYNIDNTREPKPVDYPEDNTTTPNAAVAKLNGTDPNKRIGPSIILKVMAGDTIQAAVRAFYRQQPIPKNNTGLPAEQILAGLLQAFAAPMAQATVTHGGDLMPNNRTVGPNLTTNDLQQLKNKDPQNNKLNKPKAYLNYVFFDNQFNFVNDGSGIKQVDGEPNQLETLASGKVVAKKNGFVYVYTSNESQQDVLFDNFGVMQITGPVLEETHYYPFGLTMAGISTTAPLKIENRFKFNGKELNHNEFNDGTGLEWYDFGARIQDPQIGRFTFVDPKSADAPEWSPYRFGLDNPIRFIDFDGKWERDANGNLVAEKGDNAWTLAKYLNTSAEISIDMLNQQGYTINRKGILNLNVGDVFNIEYSSPRPKSREDLGFIGNNIRKRAGSEFSKDLFENYWNGKGNLELSGERFAGILMYVKDKNPKSSAPVPVNFLNSKGEIITSGSKKAVSFYSSPEYDKAFGTATLYYNSKGNIIGFYDKYDFDSKPWGERSTKNEIITRSVEMFSPDKARDFDIDFGYSNRW
ncbi:MAG: hypothetical protein EPN39_21215 [Chitinophagaceae bacterium]|nr:MAG: hypothetical protein EPN39_21215 [Chitinophagaceae bacterium]